MKKQSTVLTPCGSFVVTWDGEDDLPSYFGASDAVSYFTDFLSLELVTGLGGNRLSAKGIQPAELHGFCQSADYGIAVLPDPDLLASDDDDFSDDEPLAVLDSVFPSALDEAKAIIERLNEGDGDRDMLVSRMADLIPLVEIEDADEMADFQEAAAQAVGGV